MANSTPDTPDVSETKLAALKMDQLRAHARKLGIDGADELHKPELLAKVKDHHYAQAHGRKHRNGSGARSSTRGHPSAAELSSMKLGELREHARTLRIDGADELHKPELLAKVKDHHAAASRPSATELSSMKLAELREHARTLRIDGADELHKPELLAKVKDHHYAQAHGGKHRPDTGSGSTGGAGGPSTADEDRVETSTPGTPETNNTAVRTNNTAVSAASTDKAQDRPHAPGVHSSDVDSSHESGPARSPEQAGSGHQQVSALASSAELDVDREPTIEPIREAADDQAVPVEQPKRVRPERVRPERVRPEMVRPEMVRPEMVRPEMVRPERVWPERVWPERVWPEVMLPEELSVVDPGAVLEDREVPDPTIHTAPATVAGEIRTGGPEADADGPNVRRG